MDQKIADDIIRRLGEGEPLSVICRTEGYPHRSTFHEWRKTDADLEARYVAAKLAGFDAIADDCLSIADDGSRDYVPGEEGGLMVDRDHIQRSKLRVETRLKLLAKWYPTKYGDKLGLEHSGSASFSLTVTRKHKAD